MKPFIAGLLVAVFCVSLYGCETVKGFGRDLQNTGDNVRDAFTGDDLD